MGDSAAGRYAINGSGLTANNGNYVFVQASGNATALTITAPNTGPTPEQVAANAGVLNPIVMEPGSSNTNTPTGNTYSNNAFWTTWSNNPAPASGNGGAPSQSGGTGTSPGSSNNVGTGLSRQRALRSVAEIRQQPLITSSHQLF